MADERLLQQVRRAWDEGDLETQVRLADARFGHRGYAGGHC